MKKNYKKPVMKSHDVKFGYNLMDEIVVVSGEVDAEVKQRNNNDFDDNAWEEY